MSGAVVSVLLWSVVVVGYACSVWSLGKVWREAPTPELVVRQRAQRLVASPGAPGRLRRVRDRRPPLVGRLRGSRQISAR